VKWSPNGPSVSQIEATPRRSSRFSVRRPGRERDGNRGHDVPHCGAQLRLVIGDETRVDLSFAKRGMRASTAWD
jgi:hypothetical protein